MTHNELLAKVKDNPTTRAVVEMHKPMLWKNLGNDTSGYKCQGCTWDLYPCPTIQAIEEAVQL